LGTPFAAMDAGTPTIGRPPSDDGQGSTRHRWRLFGPLLAVIAVVAITTFLIASHSSSLSLPGNAHSEASPHFAGETLSPRLPAPSFDGLRNYLGERVDLSEYRGKAVFVTFLYTHCPDVCPLMTAELHNALARMTPAERKEQQIIAVSVDPRRDTRKAVAEFVSAHAMTGKMKYLIGNAHELSRVWEAWNVGSEKDSVNPEFVAHSALIYGISASGRLTTIYPANFKPRQIVHDLPKLVQD
jgi:protein SCO1